MATKSDEAARDLYLSVMEEVKIRAFSINSATGEHNRLPAPLIREYCFLQLRMICELIALGCLIAHGDIKATRGVTFQKAYQADRILAMLEALHPDFYPVPVRPTFGHKSVHFDIIESGFLTKKELIVLYRKCGVVLHKGRLGNLISPNIPSQTLFPDINEWGQKILNLLSSHRITRVGGAFHFLTFLEVARLGGAVQVAIAESPEEIYLSPASK